jgi:hypothetical protein
MEGLKIVPDGLVLKSLIICGSVICMELLPKFAAVIGCSRITTFGGVPEETRSFNELTLEGNDILYIFIIFLIIFGNIFLVNIFSVNIFSVNIFSVNIFSVNIFSVNIFVM